MATAPAIVASFCGGQLSEIEGRYVLADFKSYLEHDRPTYKREEGGAFVFYWVDEEDPSTRGWFVAKEVGSDEVWCSNPDTSSLTVPASGWKKGDIILDGGFKADDAAGEIASAAPMADEASQHSGDAENEAAAEPSRGGEEPEKQEAEQDVVEEKEAQPDEEEAEKQEAPTEGQRPDLEVEAEQGEEDADRSKEAPREEQRADAEGLPEREEEGSDRSKEEPAAMEVEASPEEAGKAEEKDPATSEGEENVEDKQEAQEVHTNGDNEKMNGAIQDAVVPVQQEVEVEAEAPAPKSTDQEAAIAAPEETVPVAEPAPVLDYGPPFKICLVFTEGGHIEGAKSRLEFELKGDKPLKLGRHRKNEVVLTHPGVSNYHLELRLRGVVAGTSRVEPRLAVRDVSSNGSGLQAPGASLTELTRGSDVPVQDGSVIMLPMKLGKSAEWMPEKAGPRVCFTVHFGEGPKEDGSHCAVEGTSIGEESEVPSPKAKKAKKGGDKEDRKVDKKGKKGAKAEKGEKAEKGRKGKRHRSASPAEKKPKRNRSGSAGSAASSAKASGGSDDRGRGKRKKKRGASGGSVSRDNRRKRKTSRSRSRRRNRSWRRSRSRAGKKKGRSRSGGGGRKRGRSSSRIRKRSCRRSVSF